MHAKDQETFRKAAGIAKEILTLADSKGWTGDLIAAACAMAIGSLAAQVPEPTAERTLAVLAVGMRDTARALRLERQEVAGHG